MAKIQILTFQGAIHLFLNDTGKIPTIDEGLVALMVDPGRLEGWKGPYVSDIPLDPWGRPYIYNRNNEGYDLRSYGRDGIPGGRGEDADIFISD